MVADVILSMVETYQKTTDEKEKRWIQDTLKWGCRGLERFSKIKVSRKAQEKANKMGIGDLKQYTSWNDQKTKMKDPERAIFQWEHIYPVSQLRDDLLALKSPNIKGVSKLIRKMQVAWILYEENEKLNEAGYKSKRPPDAYVKAGIELL